LASYGGQVVRELPYFDAASPSQDHIAKDDATMRDTVEKVAERLAQLEKTVAEGFFRNNERFENIDARLDKLEHKFDVQVESLRVDIQTVLEALTAFTDEMRRTTASIRREGAADREILKLALQDHGRRIHGLEKRATSSSA
jgi:hypothetical protein